MWAVAHGPAHDPAQHVAAPLVDGSTPSAIRKAQARMWSAMTRMEDRCGILVGIGAGGVAHGLDQGAQQVDVVVVVLALQHGGDAFQAHAGVDGGPGQRLQLALRGCGRTA